MSRRSTWAQVLLRCAYRARLSVAFKFFVAASLIVWGSVFMYFKGESDYNMFYVAGVACASRAVIL